jgi:hypothetical protein
LGKVPNNCFEGFPVWGKSQNNRFEGFPSWGKSQNNRFEGFPAWGKYQTNRFGGFPSWGKAQNGFSQKIFDRLRRFPRGALNAPRKGSAGGRAALTRATSALRYYLRFAWF